MTPLSPQELAQRLREAEMPFWMKLRWLEHAGRMAVRLKDGPVLPAPAWARQSAGAPAREQGSAGQALENASEPKNNEEQKP